LRILSVNDKFCKNEKQSQWTDKILALAQWCKEIGLAPVAVRRSQNCLLNRMVQDRFIAEIATRAKTQMVAEETIIVVVNFHQDQWCRETGLVQNVALQLLNCHLNLQENSQFIAGIVIAQNALIARQDADSKFYSFI
jgi:hypothetical protein